MKTTTSLSNKAKKLLAMVCESSVESGDDPRGYYAEFESNGYKPWHPKDVAELEDAGLVTLHDESDPVPSLNDLRVDEENDSDEEYDGVAFLNATQAGQDAAKELGLL